jgi:hypothetical protein
MDNKITLKIIADHETAFIITQTGRDRFKNKNLRDN